MKRSSRSPLRWLTPLFCVVILVVGQFGYLGIHRALEATDRLVRSGAELSILANAVQVRMLLHRRYEKDFLLNLGDPVRQAAYLKRFREITGEMRADISRLVELAAEVPLLGEIELPRRQGGDAGGDRIYQRYLDGAQQARRVDLRRRLEEADHHYERYIAGFEAVARRLAEQPVSPQEGNRLMLPHKPDIYQIEFATRDAAAAGRILLERLAESARAESLRHAGWVLGAGILAALLLAGAVLVTELTWRRGQRAQRRAAAALDASEERYRTLFDHTGAATFLFDAEHRIRACNRKFERLAGYSREQVVDRLRWEDLVDPEDLSRLQQYSEQRDSGAGRPPPEFEFILVDAAGARKDIHVQIGRVPGSDESVASLTDITQERQAERRKEELEAQLRQSQKLEAIGTLAGGIAHDFNNILCGAVGYTDLARLAVGPDNRVRRYLDQVDRSLERATELVRQILTFSRRSEQIRQPLQLPPVIKEVLKLLRSTIPSSIEIVAEIDAGCGPVLADPVEIHQILMNLCTNAYHAMDEAGGTLTVELVSVGGRTTTDEAPDTAADAWCRLVVTDTGAGIDPETQKRIFEPFFTTKEVGQGTGMGLAMVHGIVTDLGGVIEVHSDVGSGTVFQIDLPCGPAQAPAAAADAPEVSLGGTERLLLVDDEAIIVQYLAEGLEVLGYQVTATTRSLEAIDSITAEPAAFDVVLADQTMPRLTGTELAAQVREVRPELPIVMMTGRHDSVSRERREALRLDAVLIKPLTVRTVAATLRRILDGPGRERCPVPPRPRGSAARSPRAGPPGPLRRSRARASAP